MCPAAGEQCLIPIQHCGSVPISEARRIAPDEPRSGRLVAPICALIVGHCGSTEKARRAGRETRFYRLRRRMPVCRRAQGIGCINPSAIRRRPRTMRDSVIDLTTLFLLPWRRPVLSGIDFWPWSGYSQGGAPSTNGAIVVLSEESCTFVRRFTPAEINCGENGLAGPAGSADGAERRLGHRLSVASAATPSLGVRLHGESGFSSS